MRSNAAVLKPEENMTGPGGCSSSGTDPMAYESAFGSS